MLLKELSIVPKTKHLYCIEHILSLYNINKFNEILYRDS